MSAATEYTRADAAIRSLSDALDALEQAVGHFDGADVHLAAGARRLALHTRIAIAAETEARDAAEPAMRAEQEAA